MLSRSRLVGFSMDDVKLLAGDCAKRGVNRGGGSVRREREPGPTTSLTPLGCIERDALNYNRKAYLDSLLR